MKSKSNKIVDGLILLSPFLDLFISVLIYKFSSFSIIGTAIRGCILLSFLVYVILLKKNTNKKIGLYIVVLCTYILIFLINRFIIYPQYFKSELISTVKYMFFPLLLTSLIVSLKKEKEYDNNIFLITAILYSIFLIVPFITNTNLLSYSNSKAGNIGWFYSPNEISSIVSILSPFILIKSIKEKNTKYKILYFILASIYILIICNIGTKTPVLSLIIILVSILFIISINYWTNKKNKKEYITNLIINLVLIVLTILSFALGAISSNMKLQGYIYYKDVVKDLSKYNSNKNNKPNNSSNNNQEDERITVKENDYKLISDMFKAPEKTSYKSNRVFNLILSSRDIYFVQKLQNLDNYNFYDYLIGLGKNQRINETISDKSIEIDFLDILFNFGIIGFVLYFTIIVYILVKLLKYLFVNFKKVIRDYELCELYLSIMVAVLISCTSGHILGAPSVSLILAIIIAKLYVQLFNINTEKKKMLSLKKCIICLLVIISCSLLSYIVNYFEKKNVPSFEIIFNNDYKVENTNNYESILETEKNIISEFASDNIKLYTIKNSKKDLIKYAIITRTFTNGITFKYITVKNISYDDIHLKLDIKNSNNKINLDGYEITKDYSYTVGYDKTSLPDYYVNSNNNSYLVYKSYIYKMLEKDYDYDYSVLKEMQSELDLEKEESIMLNKGEMLDKLIVIGNENLLNESELEDYVKLMNNGQTSSWLSFDGAYTKLPYSIEPFTKEGYGRNLGNLVEKGVFSKYLETNNSFFEAIVLSSFHVLDKYVPQYSNGVWLTEYTSTWLKEPYNTTAHYFDTRHNDTISIHINNVNKYLSYKTLSNWSNNYNEFLVYLSSLDSALNKYEEGNLLLDYYSIHNNELKNHSSLNHQLAMINSLYNGYLNTYNRNYRKLADEYLKTITNIGKKWIRDNGDLWYEITPNGEFDGTDYKTLTLEDLLKTQELYSKIYGSKNQKLDILINSKVKYLKSTNYEFDSYLTNLLKKGKCYD